jgi:hypothetical protein
VQEQLKNRAMLEAKKACGLASQAIVRDHDRARHDPSDSKDVTGSDSYCSMYGSPQLKLEGSPGVTEPREAPGASPAAAEAQRDPDGAPAASVWIL